MPDLIDTARAGAVETLLRCCHDLGLKASARAFGHKQIWARDSMITLLGASLVDHPQVSQALRASLRTLAAHQSACGSIPNNVDPETGRSNFRAYADGGLWFVIGSTIVDPDPRAIARVFEWYECQDVDQTGLISIQESSDWEDLFCTRGKGLYVNCLYVLALKRAAAALPGSNAWLERACPAAAQINRLFWYQGDSNLLPQLSLSFSTENIYYDSLGRHRWLPEKRFLVNERYYLPYIAFRAAGEWFDTFGNLLAILSGVADEERTCLILDFIERHALATRPIKAIHPPVQPGDPDWRDYYGALNAPDCYHNGGIWPFLGGFYVAALVKAGQASKAAAALEQLAALNLAGEFNEWHHGQTGEPAGVRDQAWSAGMYLYAYECVARNTLVYC